MNTKLQEIACRSVETELKIPYFHPLFGTSCKAVIRPWVNYYQNVPKIHDKIIRYCLFSGWLHPRSLKLCFLAAEQVNFTSIKLEICRAYHCYGRITACQALWLGYHLSAATTSAWRTVIRQNHWYVRQWLSIFDVKLRNSTPWKCTMKGFGCSKPTDQQYLVI